MIAQHLYEANTSNYKAKGGAWITECPDFTEYRPRRAVFEHTEFIGARVTNIYNPYSNKYVSFDDVDGYRTDVGMRACMVTGDIEIYRRIAKH